MTDIKYDINYDDIESSIIIPIEEDKVLNKNNPSINSDSNTNIDIKSLLCTYEQKIEEDGITYYIFNGKKDTKYYKIVLENYHVFLTDKNKDLAITQDYFHCITENNYFILCNNNNFRKHLLNNIDNEESFRNPLFLSQVDTNNTEIEKVFEKEFTELFDMEFNDFLKKHMFIPEDKIKEIKTDFDINKYITQLKILDEKENINIKLSNNIGDNDLFNKITKITDIETIINTFSSFIDFTDEGIKKNIFKLIIYLFNIDKGIYSGPNPNFIYYLLYFVLNKIGLFEGISASDISALSNIYLMANKINVSKINDPFKDKSIFYDDIKKIYFELINNDKKQIKKKEENNNNTLDKILEEKKEKYESININENHYISIYDGSKDNAHKYYKLYNYYFNNIDNFDKFTNNLGNLGSTCFLNAILQVFILHTPNITKFFYNNGKPHNFIDSPITNIISEFVNNIYVTEDDKFKPNNLKYVFEREIQNIFIGYEQQDASEAFRYIYDKLDDEMNKLINNNENIMSLYKYNFNNIKITNILCNDNATTENLDSEFGKIKDYKRDEGNAKSQIYERNGEYAQKVIEDSLFLQLPLFKINEKGEVEDKLYTNNTNITELINNHSRWEKTNHEKCIELENITYQKYTYEIQSKYICIQLLRFKPNIIDNIYVGTLKHNNIINFGPEITLSDKKYKLYGIITNKGGDKMGHYYAYVLDRVANNDTFIKLDDQKPIEKNIGIDEIMSDLIPYMLFYERIDDEGGGAAKP